MRTSAPKIRLLAYGWRGGCIYIPSHTQARKARKASAKEPKVYPLHDEERVGHPATNRRMKVLRSTIVCTCVSKTMRDDPACLCETSRHLLHLITLHTSPRLTPCHTLPLPVTPTMCAIHSLHISCPIPCHPASIWLNQINSNLTILLSISLKSCNSLINLVQPVLG